MITLENRFGYKNVTKKRFFLFYLYSELIKTCHFLGTKNLHLICLLLTFVQKRNYGNIFCSKESFIKRLLSFNI